MKTKIFEMIHGLYLILILILIHTFVGSAQEVIDLREGKVDTICEKLVINDVMTVEGKKIITELEDTKIWKRKLEKIKRKIYIVRDDGIEKITGINKRRYKKIDFIILVARNNLMYVILLPGTELVKGKLAGIHKDDTIKVCMYCEQGSFDILTIGHVQFANMLILLDENYEVSLYARRTNRRYCFIKDVENMVLFKK